jgi:hypothetical protein
MLVQNASATNQVLRLSDDLGPAKAIMDLSHSDLKPGTYFSVDVWNSTNTSKICVLRDEKLFEEPVSYRVARVGEGHYLIDPVRAFLGFVEILEFLLRLKPISRVWSGSDYFGADFGRSDLYPASFEEMDKAAESAK